MPNCRIIITAGVILKIVCWPFASLLKSIYDLSMPKTFLSAFLGCVSLFSKSVEIRTAFPVHIYLMN